MKKILFCFKQWENIFFALALFWLNFMTLWENKAIFSKDLYLTEDFAASSIAIFEAMTHGRLYGIPSWNGYFHPGPVLFYYYGCISGFLEFLSGHTLSIVASTWLSHLLLVNIVIIVVYVTLISTPGLSKGISLSITLTLITLLVAQPRFIYYLWEPQTAAIVFLMFFAFTVNAMMGNFASLIIAILLGLICFQIQLTILPVIFITTILTVVIYIIFSNIKWKNNLLQKIALMILAAILGLLPMLVDILFNRANNIQQLLLYSKAASVIGKLTFSEAFQALNPNLALSSIIVFVFIVILLLLVFFLSKNHEIKLQAESLRSSIAIIAIGCCGIISALIFYLYLANPSYAPPHPTNYAYLCLGIIIGGIFAVLLKLLSDQKLSIIAVNLVMIFLIVLTSYSNRVNFRDQLSGIGIVKSTEMTRLIEDTTLAVKNQNLTIGINVAFPSPGVNVSSDYLNLPWSIAVGYANIMRRNNISYCIMPIASSPYASKIIGNYASTEQCQNSSKIIQVGFYCKDNYLQGYFDNNKYEITKCYSDVTN